MDGAPPTLWPRISRIAPAREMAYPGSPVEGQEPGHEVFFPRDAAEQQAAGGYAAVACPVRSALTCQSRAAAASS